MRLKTVVLLQNIIIALTSVVISGFITININYGLRVKSQVDSIFLDIRVMEKGFRNMGIDGELSYDKSQMYKKFNHALNDTRVMLRSMGILFDIYFKDNSGLTYSYNYRNLDVVVNSLEGKSSYLIKESKEGRTYIYAASPSLEEVGNCVIFIRKDITKLKEDRRNQYLLLLLVTAILSTILVPISLFLSGRVTTPLNNLIFNISNFFNKDLYRLHSNNSIIEVEKLENEFSRLIEIIDSKIELLKKESYNKELFINKLNHELNTPVTSIIGFSNLLLSNSYKKDKTKEFIENIKREGERIRDLNINLQELLLPVDNYQFEVIYLKELLDEVLITLSPSIENKFLKLKVDVGEIKIKGNRDLLHSLIKNLIENAIIASNPGEFINIFLKDDSVLMVSDRGIGIPEEELDMVKKPYFSGRGSKGLGLYICEEIVKYHGCNLKLVKNHDRGITSQVDFTTILQLC